MALECTDNILALLQCPRCRSGIDNFRCKSASCYYSRDGFPTANHQPVLIDFNQSIFMRSAYEGGRGVVIERDESGQGFRTRVRHFTTGQNRVAERNANRLLRRMADNRTILIIGGGVIGAGVKVLLDAPRIRIVSIDVYASPNTTLVADGHALPFADESFDAVWIQAVLEHVLDPNQVVAEIQRVLRPEGLIYAETPFMQQVHEGAFDFTRFTLSGHRWLFRSFKEIESGLVTGAGTTLVWAIRYFLRALTGSNKFATLGTIPVFWLRFLDGRGRWAKDAANGVFFFGSKSEQMLQPKDMIAYYESQT